MTRLRAIGGVAAIAFGVVVALGEARRLTEGGLLLLAGVAAIALLLSAVAGARWLQLIAGAVALGALAFSAGEVWSALAAAALLVVAWDAMAAESRLATYRDRLPDQAVDQAVRSHVSNLPAPWLVLALVAAGTAVVAWLARRSLGPAADSSVELMGVSGVVFPGMLVLLLPLALGALRQRA